MWAFAREAAQSCGAGEMQNKMRAGKNAAEQAQKVANAIKTGNRGAGALRWLGGRERPVRHAFCARRSFKMRAEMRRELATVSF